LATCIPLCYEIMKTETMQWALTYPYIVLFFCDNIDMIYLDDNVCHRFYRFCQYLSVSIRLYPFNNSCTAEV